jgi:transposase-like protein
MRDQTKTKRDKAVQMRKGGSSVEDIADVLELSKSRVYELLKKNLNGS